MDKVPFTYSGLNKIKQELDNLKKKEVQSEAIDRRNERENMREEKPSSDDSEMRDNSFSQPSRNNEFNPQDGNRE